MESDAIGDLLHAMAQLGYKEHSNVRYEWRFADGDYGRLPRLAAELAKMKPDVIVTEGTPATRAARQAAPTTPIVMTVTGDPIASGFISTLAQPGGNITGLTQISADVALKELELHKSVAPKLAHLAHLSNPDNPASVAVRKSLQAASQKVGIRLSAYEARSFAEIEAAFIAIKQGHAEALIVSRDILFFDHRRKIVTLATKNRLPTSYGYTDYAEVGGLMSYGWSIREQWRRAASYVDRILKGAKPRDMPVEQPTTLELVLNLKTAKALGVTFPRDVLVRADRVIE
jgi:putative ABC transport system substrate-binding protein